MRCSIETEKESFIGKQTEKGNKGDRQTDAKRKTDAGR
jgi:hypothetical protein